MTPLTDTPIADRRPRRVAARGIELAYEDVGAGEPLVLVHGSWTGRATWLPIIAGLAESHRVISYDRRGYSESARAGHARTRRDHEDDLGAVIERLCGGTANVVGTSFGGSIALGLATRRPELVRSVVVHEPPLVALTAGVPDAAADAVAVQSAVESIVGQLQSGEVEAGTRRFFEEIALGPGVWEFIPPEIRATAIGNATAFVAEQRDDASGHIDRSALARIEVPVLVTDGDTSPKWFGPIVRELVQVTHGAERTTYSGAGHAPQLSHPDEVVASVTAFAERVAA